ncbi:MAG: Rrf2 family transcriptional regulator [Planctomycetota bacterium]
MHLSKRTQYGLRAAVRLAGRFDEGAYVQSRDLSAEEQLPTKFLEQVLLVLRRGGLLESKVGSGGGYRLRRAPRDITVGQLLAVLEPETELDLPRPMTVGATAVKQVATAIEQAEAERLDRWTLADLAEEAARVSETTSAMYYI